MRGLFSILFSPTPDIGTFRSGILLLSCSEHFAERIAEKVCAWMPDVQWTIVKRFEPPFSWFKGETIVSSYAGTLSRQWKLFRRVRAPLYDVAVIACTNEKSYNPLKTLGVCSGAGSLVIFNENLDAYIACRDTRATLINHLRWRLRQRKYPGGRRIVLNALSWVFLFPPAFLYLSSRTMIRLVRKRLSHS